jgi:hypothetical protein
MLIGLSLVSVTHFLIYLIYTKPVTVAERSKACTVFARSEAGIVGSNHSQGMVVVFVCVCVCVCVRARVLQCLCTGNGLAMG